jgi:hypothetical protein
MQRLLYGCTLTAVAIVTFVNAESFNEDWQQQPETTEIVQQYVQMPPQQRVLPAQRSFLAVCAIVKVVGVDQGRLAL